MSKSSAASRAEQEMHTGTARRIAVYVLSTLASTYRSWREDRAIRLGAGLAYYGLFAIVPLLTVAVVIAGLVFSEGEVQSYLSDRLTELIGTDVSDFTEELTGTLHQGSTQASLGLIGFASLLLAASLLFIAFQDALNVIFHAPVRRGIATTLRRRFVAFGVVMLTGSMLVVSLALQAVTGLVEAIIPGEPSIVEPLADLFGLATSAVMIAGVIALLLRTLPYATVPWRYALVGGAATAVALAIGTWAAGWYLSRFGASSLAGAASSVLLVLVWIYFAAQIVIVGAELTKVLTRESEARHALDDA